MKVHVRIQTKKDLVDLAAFRAFESAYGKNSKVDLQFAPDNRNIELIYVENCVGDNITVYWRSGLCTDYCFIEYDGRRNILYNENSPIGAIIAGLLNKDDENSEFRAIKEIPTNFEYCEYISFESLNLDRPWIELEGVNVPVFSH
ncbi:MAG TPA: hypothetical protein DCL21_07445 [Alphaproteobacteria bacterium]|nr:hypothetical protein [Alphaproteobacteria bacterium]